MKTTLTHFTVSYFCFLIFAFLFFLQSTNAQSGYSQPTNTYDQQQVAMLRNTPMNGFFGISFTNMVPQNEFFSNLPKTGLGLSIYGGYYADPVPIAFGMQFDFLFNGSSERDLHAQWQDINGFYHDYFDTLSTQSMVIPITVFARIQPNVLGWVFPYVEVFGGASIFNMSTSFKTSLSTINYDYNNSSNKTSATWCYGAAVGLMVKIADFIQLPSSHTALFVDTKLRFTKGGLATYYKGEINNSTTPPSANITEFHSQTDMVVFLFGFTFCF